MPTSHGRDTQNQGKSVTIGFWAMPGNYDDLIKEAESKGYKYHSKWIQESGKGVGIWCIKDRKVT